MFHGTPRPLIVLPESATLKDLKDAVAAKTGLATHSQERDGRRPPMTLGEPATSASS